MTNKITLRIPTKEQFAFVELVLEDVTAEEAKEYYDHWTKEFVGEFFEDGSFTGLPQKEFNGFLDTYITTGKPPANGMDLWQSMSREQKIVVDEIKKSINRRKEK